MIDKVSFGGFDIQKVIDFLERDRFSPFTAFIYLLILGIIRSVSESLYFEYPVFSMYLIAQHIAFNFPVLVLGVLVVHKATGTQIRKVFNVVLLGFWITALPPFIDKYIFGLSGYQYSGMYSYYAGYEGALLIEKIAMILPTHLLAAEHISPGLRFMIFSIVIFSGFYIFVKLDIHNITEHISRGVNKAIIRSVSALFFGFFGIWLVVWFITATVPSVIGIQGEYIVILDYIRTPIWTRFYTFFYHYGYSSSEVFSGYESNMLGLAEGTVLQQRSLFITMYFTILTAISFLICLYTSSKGLLKRILRTINTPTVYFTTLSALLGNGVLTYIDGDFSKGWALDPTFPLHFSYIFYITVMGFFIGCFAVFVNTVLTDTENRLSTYMNKRLAIVSFCAVASFSFLMGPFNTFPIALASMGIIFLLSAVSEQFLGLINAIRVSIISLFSFFLGIYTPGIWKSVIWETENGVPQTETFTTIDLTRSPSISTTIIGLVVIIFIAVVILMYLSHLLKNDKFTLKYPVSFVVLPIFLFPIFLFQDLLLLGIFATLGSIGITFMEDNHHTPLYIMVAQMICLLLWFWGFLPAL